MSHTHDDRVADIQPGMCAGYGCTLVGTMNSATNGGGDWFCWLHAGKDGGHMQLVTRAINQHRWLAETITRIRSLVPTNPRRGEDMQRIAHDLDQHQRPDLRWAGGRETVRQWTARLEQVLDELVVAEIATIPKAQAPLATPDSLNAAQYLPQWA